jgi:hypothetical protein
MASYSYGKKTRVRRSGVKAIGPTSAELEASMAKYTLPSDEPRGDSPGGTYNRGRPWGRTGDMQYGSNARAQQDMRQSAARRRYRQNRNALPWSRNAYQRS